jgi:hypothetical protein
MQEPIYDLVMQRLCELRSDAARGRDYRRAATAAK